MHAPSTFLVLKIVATAVMLVLVDRIEDVAADLSVINPIVVIVSARWIPDSIQLLTGMCI